MRNRTLLVAAAGLLAFAAEPALADDIIVQRDVTVREEPVTGAQRVDFVDPGDRLDLLDEGVQRNGYYHVRLPDGREGWVYRSFVRRVPDAQGGAVEDRMTAHYIDVEQGAAALLEFPCGAILIDAGGRGTAAGDHLIDYLNAFFERRPDLGRRLAAVFVTHTHVDHNSNLRRVTETFDVGGYVHNGVMTGSGRTNAGWMVTRATTGTPRIPVAAMADVPPGGASGPIVDPLACPRVDPRIVVLSGALTQNPGWPAGEFNNGNNHSLVVRVDYGESAFLFTGDLEEHAIERLVELYGPAGSVGPKLDVDVYAVGHHGSYNGTTEPLLAAMSPDVAVISMGPHTVQAPWTAWAYGHPRRTLVEMLDRSVSRPRAAPKTVMVADRVKTFTSYTMADAVYATGWDGDVAVTGGADGVLQVRTGR